MHRQGLRNISRRLSHAAVLCTFMAVALASQEAAAACRGTWAEGTTYTAGDSVTYSGATYTARVTHTACVGCGWNPVAAETG
ncbi:carbohydrate-binding protein [Pyxidicoccus fallax]|uniref:carbohydrate-binding protein n=1 Tax=Pyxidicoccus fallax TaxID=394095 RepID=UPI00345788F6